MSTRTTVLLFAALATLSGCVTTTTRTTTWGESAGSWELRGRVTSIRETVHHQDGNPAGGAAVGALVGGVLGSSIGGHTHYDRWGRGHHHGSGVGALFGAIGGAMVGAATSQGHAEQRSYEVFVRFDDGRTERFVYRDGLPFRVGDDVVWTDRGLSLSRV